MARRASGNQWPGGPAEINGPEGQRKLAGGASHRIRRKIERAPEGAPEIARLAPPPPPPPGRIPFWTRSGGSRHRLIPAFRINGTQGKPSGVHGERARLARRAVRPARHTGRPQAFGTPWVAVCIPRGRGLYARTVRRRRKHHLTGRKESRAACMGSARLARRAVRPARHTGRPQAFGTPWVAACIPRGRGIRHARRVRSPNHAMLLFQPLFPVSIFLKDRIISVGPPGHPAGIRNLEHGYTIS